jgi:hypothetical protein
MLLVRSKIPTDITTVEELAIWAVSSLGQACGAKEFVEGDNLRPQFVADVSFFKCPDSSYRTVARLSVPLKNDVLATSVPFWKKTAILYDGDIPQNFSA